MIPTRISIALERKVVRKVVKDLTEGTKVEIPYKRRYKEFLGEQSFQIGDDLFTCVEHPEEISFYSKDENLFLSRRRIRVVYMDRHPHKFLFIKWYRPTIIFHFYEIKHL